ncbi:MAG: PIN domain-containing protein [Firmicutes bacterium]|nr:PIN domain-containing protein [Bacillota bacterium]
MSGAKGLQFVDTNILIYSYNINELQKHQKAFLLLSQLWNSGQGALSIQVLQEFYVVVTQKLTNRLSPETAIQIIEDLSNWTCHIPEIADMVEAIYIQQKNTISFWDALIICSAKKVGAEIIWSEDLNHNQLYEGIIVKNPFIDE